jgi:hypothetical protein
MGYKNGKAPNDNANASNGVITGHGSGDSYPNGASGSNWPAPNNHATATDGQTTGHPSQKTTYPSKGGGGGKQYIPKGGNML